TAAEASSDQPSYEDLVKLLTELQAKVDDSNDRALRAQAELDNVRRRAQRDVEGAHKFALEKFVNALLPVKDSLDMGDAAANVEGVDIEKVREGLTLTSKMMTDVMGKFNVVEVNPVGERFNPDHHQAMSMQDLPDAPPNTVVNVFQKGYLLNERLVRPAMVVVSSANSGSNLSSDEPPTGGKVDELA
ncbi:nucleotide exchange factor GrpE, partial [Pseudomonadota bacterium]